MHAFFAFNFTALSIKHTAIVLRGSLLMSLCCVAHRMLERLAIILVKCFYQENVFGAVTMQENQINLH